MNFVIKRLIKKAFVVFYSFLSVTPIVELCNGSMFCCALLCVHSSFAIISMEEIADCFALFVFLVSRDCCVALPHATTDLSAICDLIVVFPDHTHLIF